MEMQITASGLEASRLESSTGCFGAQKYLLYKKWLGFIISVFVGLLFGGLFF